LATKQLTTIKLLILDPSSNDAEQTINAIRNSGIAVRPNQINNQQDLESALDKEQSWDLFLAKDKTDDITAEQCMKIISHYKSDVPCILLTDNYSVERTVDGLKLGMRDVLPSDHEEYFQLVIQRELSALEDRRRREQADNYLLETEKRNELLLDSSRDAIAYIHDGMHIYANHAYLELFGYEDPEDIEIMPIMNLMTGEHQADFKAYLKAHTKGESQSEFRFQGLKQNGDTFDAVLSLSDAKYDGEDCTQVYLQTGGESDEAIEAKLKELSALDRITGLYNQHYLMDKITETTTTCAENEQYALYYAELDKWDEVQDQYGISAAEKYLVSIANWLKAECQDADIVARIGDDTFAILRATESDKEAIAFGETLNDKFSENLFEADDHTIKNSLSTGICMINNSSPNSDKILSNAHFAATHVKSHGSNAVRMHDSTMDSLENREDAELAMDLSDDLESGKIKVFYQPLVKIHGNVHQFYTARLLFADTQPINSKYTIGNRSPIAIKLDNWLIEQALAQFKTLCEQAPDARLKMRLSAASLVEENIVQHLASMLEKHQVAKQNVVFEFSEIDVIAYLKKAIVVINEMANQGLKAGLVDFGSSVDSANLLTEINLESLRLVQLDEKLFAKFISDNEAQERVTELFNSVHEHVLTSIAPNVSDASLLAMLYPLNVGHIFGDYISPVSEQLDFDFDSAGF
jgi:multidomain signaling protein FimX